MPKGIYDRKKAKRAKAKRAGAPKKASKKRGRPPGSGKKKKAAAKAVAAPKARIRQASPASGLSREDFIGGMRAIAGAISEVADAIRETRQGAVKGDGPIMPAPEPQAQPEPPASDDRAGATVASAESLS